MEIKGKIEKVEMSTGSGNKGPWSRWAYKIDGKTFSTFNEEIGNNFKPGDFVKVQTKTSPDGKYENMISMEKIEDLNGVEDKNVGFSKSTDDLLRQILAELRSNKVEV